MSSIKGQGTRSETQPSAELLAEPEGLARRALGESRISRMTELRTGQSRQSQGAEGTNIGTSIPEKSTTVPTLPLHLVSQVPEPITRPSLSRRAFRGRNTFPEIQPDEPVFDSARSRPTETSALNSEYPEIPKVMHAEERTPSVRRAPDESKATNPRTPLSE